MFFSFKQNSRLSSTYTVKAFKEFLIHRNKSTRLPKVNRTKSFSNGNILFL